MNEALFEDKLKELVNEISSMPSPQKDKLITLIKQTGDCHKQLRQSVSTLQESLDYLRVSIKYLIFDLEATRRENAELQRQLNENPVYIGASVQVTNQFFEVCLGNISGEFVAERFNPGFRTRLALLPATALLGL